MSKLRLATIGLLIISTGCFTTKIRTAATSDGQERDRRQVFTLGGLVPLSTPDAGECKYGVARADSSFGPIDVLVWLGVTVAGGVLGATACSNSIDGGFTCANLGATLGPVVFGTRTVTYQCAAPPLVLQESKSTTNVVSDPPLVPSDTAPDNSVAARLERLDKLLQAGTITAEEHAEKRKKILEEL